MREQLGIAIEQEVCRGGERDGAVCTAGKLAMRQEIYPSLVGSWVGQETQLASNALLDHLTPFTTFRHAFGACRFMVTVTPFILAVLGALVLLFSWRLRTAIFMFGYCLLVSGWILGLVGSLVTGTAAFLDLSPEVWGLVLEESQVVYSGLGIDSMLLAGGACLLLIRALGPRWRRSFWSRHASSTNPEAARFAKERASAPAGLLEPWHMLRAARSRR